MVGVLSCRGRASFDDQGEKSVKNVADLRAKIERGTQVVLIEEVQFFDESVCDLAVELADKGKEVICAGLDQDFRREPFGPMPRLPPSAQRSVRSWCNA